MEFEANLQYSSSFKIYHHTLEFFGLWESCVHDSDMKAIALTLPIPHPDTKQYCLHL
ncbi:MAG: hypothetical protein VKL39_19060 [Leptolyngbyaceae bacterium]|nr:hypothetical protein [Leptolyngbyaceae bacterium]